MIRWVAIKPTSHLLPIGATFEIGMAFQIPVKLASDVFTIADNIFDFGNAQNCTKLLDVFIFINEIIAQILVRLGQCRIVYKTKK